MVDQRIQRLKRQLKTDPDDSSLRFELLTARARIEGESVYLEPLDDCVIWDQCSETLQDLAISLVRRNLGEAYSHVRTKRYECGGQSHRIATFKHKKIDTSLNLIPGGWYFMGSSEKANSGLKLEKPQHEVHIEKPFLMGIYPVRQCEWDAIGDRDRREWEGHDLPLEGVSFCSPNAVFDLIPWLKKAGGSLRIPSEAEWEYACRAGSSTQYFWGDAMDDSYCWFQENSGGKTRAVTEHSSKANAFGLVDMLGNIWEWCQDVWFDNYRDGPNTQLARMTSRITDRVIRGGSWRIGSRACRSASRGRTSSFTQRHDVGFRLARDIE